MGKKDLRSVTANLAALAEPLPTQHAVSPAPAKPETTAVERREGETVVQFNLSMRKSLRRDLKRLAEDSDMTARAFVLNALKEKGLPVSDKDLLDLRKGK